MSKLLNDCWITDMDDYWCSLTLESLYDEREPYNMIRSSTTLLPENPKTKKPKRQTIVLQLFDKDDLIKLKNVIDEKLKDV